MNFFEHQDRARRKTGFLVISFIAVVIAILLIINIFIYLYGQEYTDVTTAMIWSNIIVLGVIMIGTVSKYLALRNGGKSIATMIKATPILRDSKQPEARQLINIVDEISIASGISSPRIFYMPNEVGINAFVAGFEPNDTILVVTKGALDNLSREELQGVIAHEFSHIFNADTKINLRLVAVLGGLLVLSQMGYHMLASTSRRNRNSSAAVPLLGAAIFILGYIGLFFGNVIKSAISRQREFLSDASAVQFTRNPNGIGKALLKIKNQGKGAFMHNKNSEDLSHMCFSETIKSGFMNPMSTHPKIDKRIKAIDPSGTISAEYYQELNKPKPKPKPKEYVDNKSETVSPFNDPHKLHILAGILIKSVGNPTPESFTKAKQEISSIPQYLKEMTCSIEQAKELVKKIIIDPPPQSLALMEMCMPALKEMDIKEAEQFVKELFAEAKSDKNISLHEAIVLTVLHKNLGKKSGQSPKIKYSKKKQVKDEINCIQSFLINAKDNNYSMLELIRSLRRLKHMSPNLKQDFLQECVGIVQKDGKVTADEAKLLRAICACMDCPIPL